MTRFTAKLIALAQIFHFRLVSNRQGEFTPVVKKGSRQAFLFAILDEDGCHLPDWMDQKEAEFMLDEVRSGRMPVFHRQLQWV